MVKQFDYDILHYICTGTSHECMVGKSTLCLVFDGMSCIHGRLILCLVFDGGLGKMGQRPK